MNRPRSIRNAVAIAIGVGLGTLVVAPPFADADPVGSLTSFQPGQVLRSAEINANFTEVKRAVDDNHARIGDLTSLQTSARTSLVVALNELQGQNAGNRLNSLESRVTALEGRVATLEAHRQFMTFSPTTFPNIVTGPLVGTNVDVVLRQFDGVRHLSTVQGDLNAIHAFADAPGVITIAGATLDGNSNLNPTPAPGGTLALDVVVHYNNSVTDTFTTVTTLALSLPTATSGTQRFTFTLPSLRAAAPADATGLNEITVKLNAGMSTIPAGGIGAIRCTAFVPLSQ